MKKLHKKRFILSMVLVKGTGFDKGDIAASKKGIEYGNELRMRYGKII